MASPSDSPKPAPSIARSTAVDSGSQLVAMAFGMIVGVVVARTLGSEGRGVYVLATTFATQFLLGFVNVGVELGARVYTARHPGERGAVHGVVVAITAAVAAFCGVLWLTFGHAGMEAIMPGLSPRDAMLVLGALPLLVYQMGAYGILVGLSANRNRSLFDLAYSLVQNSVVLVILVAMLGAPQGALVGWIVLSYYVVLGLSMVPLVVLLGRHGVGLAVPQRELIRNFLRYGWGVWIGNLAAGLGQRIDQYVVQRASPDLALFGVYTLATGLASRTRVFPQALSRSVYGRLASAPADEAARLAATCHRQMLLMGLGLLAVGSLCAPLLPLIYGRDFAGAVVPFMLFLAGNGAMNCSWMLANYFSGHLARPGIAAWINWGLLPFQAAAAWFAMKLGGLNAVALAAFLGAGANYLCFLTLFLRWQGHAGPRALFVPTAEDFAPWRKMLRKRG